MVNENEFLDACVGLDEDRHPKSAVSCMLLMYDAGKDTDDPLAYKEISTRYTNNGEISFVRVDGFVHVSIAFTSAFDPDLKHFWMQLKTYGEELELFNSGKEDRMPILNFNIVPKQFSDKAYLNVAFPVFWILQPKEVGDEKCSVIKILFKLNSFNIYDTPDDVNLTDEEAAANRTYRVIRTEK